MAKNIRAKITLGYHILIKVSAKLYVILHINRTIILFINIRLQTAEPCELYCTDTEESVIVPWGDSALDGTPCNVGTRDMCIAGICRVKNFNLLKLHVIKLFGSTKNNSALFSFCYS